MWVALIAAVSALIGLAVSNGRPGLLPFTVLLVISYVVARHSDARPVVIAAATALPAITVVATFGSAGMVDAWVSHVVALVVLTGLAWLLARRPRPLRRSS